MHIRSSARVIVPAPTMSTHWLLTFLVITWPPRKAGVGYS